MGSSPRASNVALFLFGVAAGVLALWAWRHRDRIADAVDRLSDWVHG